MLHCFYSVGKSLCSILDPPVMLPYSYHLVFLVAAANFLYFAAASTFELVEKEDVFKLVPCPAFLVFDTAAYLSDMTIELPCKCKPEKVNSVVWYYQKNINGEPDLVLTEYNGKTKLEGGNIYVGYDVMTRFRIEMFNLIVFKIKKMDSGHYICGTRDGHYFYGYNVDIQDSEKAYVDFEDKNGHPQADMVTNDFVSFTDFWDWTVCDRCDVRGEKRRLGLCYVRTPYLNPRYCVAEDSVASCGSNAVPARFRRLISHRRPEITIKSCTISCRKRKEGLLGTLSNLLHSVMKLKDRIPWIPKVPTQMHTHPLGRSLILACPGARPEQAVAWDKDNEPLYLSEYLIGNKASMRIYIDHGYHLNFRAVQRNDKGIYYCWVQGKIKVGFRLSVQADTGRKRSLTDEDSVFAMKVISLSFLFTTIIFLCIHCMKCCRYNFRCIPFLPKDN